MPGAERATAGDEDTPLPSREREELAAAVANAAPAVAKAEPAAIPFEEEEDGCGELKLESGTPFTVPVPEGPAELGELDASPGPATAPAIGSSSLESCELSSKRFSPDPDLLAPEFGPPELDAAQKSSELDPSSGNRMQRPASGAAAAAAAEDTLSCATSELDGPGLFTRCGSKLARCRRVAAPEGPGCGSISSLPDGSPASG